MYTDCLWHTNIVVHVFNHVKNHENVTSCAITVDQISELSHETTIEVSTKTHDYIISIRSDTDDMVKMLGRRAMSVHVHTISAENGVKWLEEIEITDAPGNQNREEDICKIIDGVLI